jgi:hypothetical protein
VQSVLSDLKSVCGFEYTNKLQRMFHDIGASEELTSRFIQVPPIACARGIATGDRACALVATRSRRRASTRRERARAHVGRMAGAGERAVHSAERGRARTAAVHDVLRVSLRRWSQAQLVCAQCRRRVRHWLFAGCTV